MIRLLKYLPTLCSAGLAALVLFASSAKAQAPDNDRLEDISIMLNVQRVGSTEVSAYMKGQTVYLSVKEVFDFLRIKNTVSPAGDTLSGFFIDAASRYLISKESNRIVFQKKVFPILPGDLIQNELGLYLPCKYFGVFGIDCFFDFRSLSVNLLSKIELPIMRDLQQALTRRSVSRLKGERRADTTIGRDFPLLRFGMADWSISHQQNLNGTQDMRYSLALGAMVAGGEVSAGINYIAGKPLNPASQFYRWRYVNNNQSWLRQVSVGKLFADATSTILAPLQGVQFTNSPTTYRRSFGTYILSNTTQPGWMVELYVNNILINYTRADASGFFTFEVPMVYGNSTVKLRFYGPWGEEQSKEQTVIIPINFLPAHQFEYNLTGGLVADSSRHRFARASFKYGLNRSVTIGGGVEYLSSVEPPKPMPYANATVRLFEKIILFGEHMQGVRTKGTLAYRHPSNFQLDVNYVKYDPAQTAVKFLEERKAVLSMPFRSKKVSGFSRLTFSQYTDRKSAPGTSAELLLSSFFAGVSSNFTTFAVITDKRNPLIWSNLSLTFRLPSGIRYTQQTYYEYRNKRIGMFQSDFERTVFKNAFLNFSFAHNLTAKTTTFGLGLRFNLSFAQASAYTTRTNDKMTNMQSVRGSFLYDGAAGRLMASDQSSVGRAGLTIVPFLDLNGNGQRDANEPKVCGLKLRVNGGRLSHCTKDTTVQVTGLEPYSNYLVEIEKTSFDNIAWQIKNATVAVVADPSSFKRIEVPVSVVSEAIGSVQLQTADKTVGYGRIIVKFYRKGKLVTRVMSEADGYFGHFGFAPGVYTAELDKTQLDNLELVAAPEKITFTIKSTMEGDLVEGLKFVLKKREGASRNEP